MELIGKFELFSPTVENRLVFDLFNLLLCGVIILVILRGWRARTRFIHSRNHLFFFLAFCSLGASFAVGAISAGAFLFFHSRLPEARFDVLIHSLRFGAWLSVVASAYYRPKKGQLESGIPSSQSSLSILLFGPLWFHLAVPLLNLHTATVLDMTNLLLLALALILFHSRPLGGGNFATGALAALFVTALLHLGSSLTTDTKVSDILWSLEQFAWSLSLFTFALAIGEAGRNLFDRVFVRLQVAFILLASFMMLVIIQTEKTEYLASIRDRSNQLAEFVRAHVSYFRQRNESLSLIIDREDFRQRVTLGFSNFPELKVVRIVADGKAASFEIADNGLIQHDLKALSPTGSMSQLDSEAYFLIHALPLKAGGPGEVEFYGTREFLDAHIRKRIILIFSMFTGMVALSTVMIGLVVRGTSAKIQQQAQEIEETQRRLMHAQKLAAIGELAAAVAHEINNPATTILSRASLLLSEDDTNISPSDREDLTAIVNQSQRIAQITGGLLMFSRRHRLDIKAVPIDRVVETALRSVSDLLTVGQISVEKNIQNGLPRVLADEDSLARALENLIHNAIDAMPDGGTLQIQAVKEDPLGKGVRLEIADNGVGIEEDKLTRIFDPFFTTKEVGKGTGLGLSIVHGIINEHSGSISVISQPGVGTKFVLILPGEEYR